MRLLFLLSLYVLFFKNLYSPREGIEQKAMKKSVTAQKTAAHTLQSHNNILFSHYI